MLDKVIVIDIYPVLIVHGKRRYEFFGKHGFHILVLCILVGEISSTNAENPQ